MEQWRKMTIFSGDVPTTEELELLKESRERVELVIRARWYLLAILSAYGFIIHIFFQDKSADVESLMSVHFIVPFAVVLFVAAYNAWYQYSYRWFVQVRSLNQVQLLFDLILVTVEVDIACRYGGEEFAIILPEAFSIQGVSAAERLRRKVESQGAVAVAERIRQDVEKVRKDELPVTVSIGVSSYPEHGVELESLIRAADDGMYRAKQLGKNRVAVAEASFAGSGPPGKKDG